MYVKLSTSTGATQFKCIRTRIDSSVTAATSSTVATGCVPSWAEKRGRQVNSSDLFQFAYVLHKKEQQINIHSLAHHAVCYVMTRPCTHATSKQELQRQVNCSFVIKEILAGITFDLYFQITMLHSFCLNCMWKFCIINSIWEYKTSEAGGGM